MSNKLEDIHKLYLDVATKTLAQRLKIFAEFFLGTDYGPWRDGSSLESLDDFQYDLDTLDCVTYVEVVLALAKTTPRAEFAQFKHEFENILKLLHYANGRPNFISRNHFMSIDWIVNNKFIVQDITAGLSDNVQIAEALIDKLTWVTRHKVNNNVALAPELAQKLQSQISRVPYITTREFLEKESYFRDIFPEYCIVNIVRPNWDLTAQIGTHLNISHLGFCFALEFYHATIIGNKVQHESMFDYMRRHVDSPTIKGINVLVIKPGYLNAG